MAPARRRKRRRGRTRAAQAAGPERAVAAGFGERLASQSWLRAAPVSSFKLAPGDVGQQIGLTAARDVPWPGRARGRRKRVGARQQQQIELSRPGGRIISQSGRRRRTRQRAGHNLLRGAQPCRFGHDCGLPAALSISCGEPDCWRRRAACDCWIAHWSAHEDGRQRSGLGQTSGQAEELKVVHAIRLAPDAEAFVAGAGPPLKRAQNKCDSLEASCASRPSSETFKLFTKAPDRDRGDFGGEQRARQTFDRAAEIGLRLLGGEAMRGALSSLTRCSLLIGAQAVVRPGRLATLSLRAALSKRRPIVIIINDKFLELSALDRKRSSPRTGRRCSDGKLMIVSVVGRSSAQRPLSTRVSLQSSLLGCSLSKSLGYEALRLPTGNLRQAHLALGKTRSEGRKNTIIRPFERYLGVGESKPWLAGHGSQPGRLFAAQAPQPLPRVGFKLKASTPWPPPPRMLSDLFQATSPCAPNKPRARLRPPRRKLKLITPVLSGAGSFEWLRRAQAQNGGSNLIERGRRTANGELARLSGAAPARPDALLGLIGVARLAGAAGPRPPINQVRMLPARAPLSSTAPGSGARAEVGLVPFDGTDGRAPGSSACEINAAEPALRGRTGVRALICIHLFAQFCDCTAPSPPVLHCPASGPICVQCARLASAPSESDNPDCDNGGSAPMLPRLGAQPLLLDSSMRLCALRAVGGDASARPQTKFDVNNKSEKCQIGGRLLCPAEERASGWCWRGRAPLANIEGNQRQLDLDDKRRPTPDNCYCKTEHKLSAPARERDWPQRSGRAVGVARVAASSAAGNGQQSPWRSAGAASRNRADFATGPLYSVRRCLGRTAPLEPKWTAGKARARIAIVALAIVALAAFRAASKLIKLSKFASCASSTQRRVAEGARQQQTGRRLRALEGRARIGAGNGAAPRQRAEAGEAPLGAGAGAALERAVGGAPAEWSRAPKGCVARARPDRGRTATTSRALLTLALLLLVSLQALAARLPRPAGRGRRDSDKARPSARQPITGFWPAMPDRAMNSWRCSRMLAGSQSLSLDRLASTQGGEIRRSKVCAYYYEGRQRGWPAVEMARAPRPGRAEAGVSRGLAGMRSKRSQEKTTTTPTTTKVGKQGKGKERERGRGRELEWGRGRKRARARFWLLPTRRDGAPARTRIDKINLKRTARRLGGQSAAATSPAADDNKTESGVAQAAACRAKKFARLGGAADREHVAAVRRELPGLANPLSGRRRTDKAAPPAPDDDGADRDSGRESSTGRKFAAASANSSLIADGWRPAAAGRRGAPAANTTGQQDANDNSLKNGRPRSEPGPSGQQGKAPKRDNSDHGRAPAAGLSSNLQGRGGGLGKSRAPNKQGARARPPLNAKTQSIGKEGARIIDKRAASASRDGRLSVRLQAAARSGRLSLASALPLSAAPSRGLDCPAEHCQCTWKGGKQFADCSPQGHGNGLELRAIPAGLDPLIQVLNMSRNRLEELPASAFNALALNNLQRVYLVSVHLKRIHPRAFENLKLIVELDFARNNLVSIPLWQMRHLTLLRRLSLRGNPLRVLDERTLNSARRAHSSKKLKAAPQLQPQQQQPKDQPAAAANSSAAAEEFAASLLRARLSLFHETYPELAQSITRENTELADRLLVEALNSAAANELKGNQHQWRWPTVIEGDADDTGQAEAGGAKSLSLEDEFAEGDASPTASIYRADDSYAKAVGATTAANAIASPDEDEQNEFNDLNSIGGQNAEPLSFGLFAHLQELDLGECELKYVKWTTLTNLRSLKRLQLDGNFLSQLSGLLVASLPVGLHQLSLEGNQWQCDCRLRALRGWLERTRTPLSGPVACSGRGAGDKFSNVGLGPHKARERRATLAELTNRTNFLERMHVDEFVCAPKANLNRAGQLDGQTQRPRLAAFALAPAANEGTGSAPTISTLIASSLLWPAQANLGPGGQQEIRLPLGSGSLQSETEPADNSLEAPPFRLVPVLEYLDATLVEREADKVSLPAQGEQGSQIELGQGKTAANNNNSASANGPSSRPELFEMVEDDWLALKCPFLAYPSASVHVIWLADYSQSVPLLHHYRSEAASAAWGSLRNHRTRSQINHPANLAASEAQTGTNFRPGGRQTEERRLTNGDGNFVVLYDSRLHAPTHANWSAMASAYADRVAGREHARAQEAPERIALPEEDLAVAPPFDEHWLEFDLFGESRVLVRETRAGNWRAEQATDLQSKTAILKETQLVIRAARLEDSARYKCLAVNRAGWDALEFGVKVSRRAAGPAAAGRQKQGDESGLLASKDRQPAEGAGRPRNELPFERRRLALATEADTSGQAPGQRVNESSQPTEAQLGVSDFRAARKRQPRPLEGNGSEQRRAPQLARPPPAATGSSTGWFRSGGAGGNSLSVLFHNVFILFSILMGAAVLAFVLSCVFIYRIKPPTSYLHAPAVDGAQVASPQQQYTMLAPSNQHHLIFEPNSAQELNQQIILLQTTTPDHLEPPFYASHQVANGLAAPYAKTFTDACQAGQQQQSMPLTLKTVCDPFSGQAHQSKLDDTQTHLDAIAPNGNVSTHASSSARLFVAKAFQQQQHQTATDYQVLSMHSNGGFPEPEPIGPGSPFAGPEPCQSEACL